MKTVGFIDYYLDEWHANKYPAWIKEKSGGELEVKYAFAAIEKEGKLSNREWAESKGILLVDTIEELVEKSDCIVVLAPDDPEQHYALAEEALRSGKPTYIDKTFSPTGEEAKRIFDLAEQYGAPCFSSSALRFSKKLQAAAGEDITTVISIGGGAPKDYLVHQVEPIAVLMGTDVEKLMFIGNEKVPAWVLQYTDGRTAEIHLLSGRCGYTHHIDRNGDNEILTIDDDFWDGCLRGMIDLFLGKKESVPHQTTIAIMTIIERCIEAMKTPFEWILL